MAIELTDAAARGAKPGVKTQRLAAGGGMYLEVTPAGGKYWRLKYRFAGKEKRLALGVYPRVTVKEARERRDQAKREINRGIDPSASRRAEKATRATSATNTFEAVAREWWESVHKSKVVAAHADRNLRRLEVHAFPMIGGRPIGDITPAELLATLQRIIATGHIETAQRVKTLCGQVFRYAIPSGRATRDISADLRDSLPTSKAKHHAAITNTHEIPPLLRAIDTYAGSAETRAALKLAPILFCRPGELRQMEWTAIDLEQALWDYAPGKGGAPLIVPLPHQAVSVLREMQSLNSRSKYVFPSVRSKDRPMSETTVNAALQRMGFKGQMTAHGFRAMARTVLVEQLGYPEAVVEMQLGHAVKDANGRAYNRATYLDQRGEMLQAWANHLDRLRESRGETQPASSDSPF